MNEKIVDLFRMSIVDFCSTAKRKIEKSKIENVKDWSNS